MKDSILSHDETILANDFYTPLGPYHRDAIACDSLRRIAASLEQIVEKLEELRHAVGTAGIQVQEPQTFNTSD